MRTPGLQTSGPGAWPSLLHTSPVSLSDMVPSAFSMKRGLGQATPACDSPSWPVPAQSMDVPDRS